MPKLPRPSKGKVVKPRIQSLSERRARNREQMIETIIDCAREIMRENGVQALNMQLLAKSVGIQPPSLYEYFENKNAIFDALYAHGLAIFQASVFKSLQKSKDFKSSVRAIFSAELSFSRKHPDLYQIVFNNALPGYVVSDHNQLKMRHGLDQGIDVIKNFLTKEKYIIPISADQAALLVDVVLSGVTTRLINLETATSQQLRSKYELLVEDIILLLTHTK